MREFFIFCFIVTHASMCASCILFYSLCEIVLKHAGCLFILDDIVVVFLEFDLFLSCWFTCWLMRMLISIWTQVNRSEQNTKAEHETSNQQYPIFDYISFTKWFNCLYLLSESKRKHEWIGHHQWIKFVHTIENKILHCNRMVVTPTQNDKFCMV